MVHLGNPWSSLVIWQLLADSVDEIILWFVQQYIYLPSIWDKPFIGYNMTSLKFCYFHLNFNPFPQGNFP